MNRADRRRQKTLGGAGATASASTLQSAFEETVRLHHDGRLSEAEKGYRRILSLAPGHPDALHLIGVLLHQSGNSLTAEQHIKQAIKANNRNPAYHRSLGRIFRAYPVNADTHYM